MLNKINFPLFLRHILPAICLASASQLATGQTTVSERIQRAEQDRFTQMATADTAALRRGLHPDLLYIHSNGLEESADDLVASVASGKIDYQSFEPVRSPRVQVFGKTALADGLVRVTGLYEGNTFAVDLRYTSVYRKMNNRWLLIRWQSTKM